MYCEHELLQLIIKSDAFVSLIIKISTHIHVGLESEDPVKCDDEHKSPLYKPCFPRWQSGSLPQSLGENSVRDRHRTYTTQYWTSANYILLLVKFEMSSKRKSLALRVTSINLVSLERGRIVEYVFQCFQLGKLDLGVT